MVYFALGVFVGAVLAVAFVVLVTSTDLGAGLNNDDERR